MIKKTFRKACDDIWRVWNERSKEKKIEAFIEIFKMYLIWEKMCEILAPREKHESVKEIMDRCRGRQHGAELILRELFGHKVFQDLNQEFAFSMSKTMLSNLEATARKYIKREVSKLK